MLRAIQNKKYQIPKDVVPIFEGIVQKYEEQSGANLVGVRCFEPEWDDDFCKALNEHLTKEQRFHLYEQNGGCNGAGADKDRRAFAIEYAHLALDESIGDKTEN